MVKFCCDDMKNNVYCTDDISSLEKDENDKVVYYSSKFREYGIPIRDTCARLASSYILIQYCPWCGCCLPESLREKWFAELEKLGFDSPMDQDIPSHFLSGEWYGE